MAFTVWEVANRCWQESWFRRRGAATDLQEVHIEPDMQPVDFQMKPGGKIRIRVVDEQDNGIPKSADFLPAVATS